MVFFHNWREVFKKRNATDTSIEGSSIFLVGAFLQAL